MPRKEVALQNVLIVLLGIGVLLLGVWLLKTFSTTISFYAKGLDSKFSLSEITMLWKLSKATDLEEPLSLYASDQALSHCVAKIIEEAKLKHTENEPKVQEFLAKLYKFRTKLALTADNRRGLSSSRALTNEQKLRIVLKGSGIFASKILNNAAEIAIAMPVQNGRIPIKANDWVGKEISVYLWRKGDAGYVFDTKVLGAGVFLGKPVLRLRQSSDLTRMQKRRSIRTECQINAHLYVITETVLDFSKIETTPGYKCLIEDISSDGALIRIGGKGVANIQMKLQFEVEHTMIVMYGTVRSVEYNAAANQSRLHIECTHIEPNMRNAILTFVYKIIPEDQKNEDIALKELQIEDGETAADTNDGAAEKADVTSSKNDGLSIDVPEDIYKTTLEEIKKGYNEDSDDDSNSEFDPKSDPDYDPKYGY